MLRNKLRMLLIVPQAAFITLLLLMLMVSLIEFADSTRNTEKRIELPNIYMPEVELKLQRIVEKPEKPKVDETPPPEIPEQDFDKIDGNAAVGKIGTPGKIETKLDLSIGAGLQVTDGEYLPIVKVAPQYPRRALSRKIEGHVILEYVVTQQGSVRDPIIIESKPSGVFDKAAIKSALKYKYKPRVVNGEPIESKGVRTKIIFRLGE